MKPSILGARLYEIRKKRRLTMAQLASATGISHATISRLETGAIQQVKSDALRSFSYALGVSTDWLLGVNSSP